MRLLQFDVRAGDAAAYLEITAWLTAITLAIILASVILYLRYAGVDAEEKRQLAAIIPQLIRASPQSMTVRRDETVWKRQFRLRRALTRDLDEQIETGEQTLRDAATMFHADLRSMMPNWPPLAVRGGLEGALILLFGAMLFYSVRWWEQALALPSIGVSLNTIASTLWQALVTGVGLFPIPEELALFGITAATLTASFLVEFWLPIGVLLIIGAVAFGVIDHVTAEDLDVTLYPRRWLLVAYVTGVVFSTWAVGVFIRGLIVRTPVSDFAAIAGFVSAVVCGLGWLGFGVWSLSQRLRSAQDRPGEDTTAVAVYILLRRGLFAAVLVAFPLMAYLGGQTVLTGAGAEVLATLAGAPLATQLLLTGAVLAVVALVLSKTSDDIGFVAALGRLWRSTALRAWLFARGVPLTAMVLAFAFTWAVVGTQPVSISYIGSLLGLWPPAVAAISVGVFVRLWTLIWTRFRYRFMTFGEKRSPQSLIVECYPELKDADGDSLYVARVQGEQLAHRDVDCLLRDIETTTEALFDGDDPPGTIASYYWNDVRRGTVDLETVRREIRGDVLSRIRSTLVDNGGCVDASVIDENLKCDYPEQAIEQMLQVLYERSDVSYRDGEYYYHGE